MNVVDSSAWLEYFADRKNAHHFAEPIEDQEKLLVPTICLYEVFKAVLRKKGEDDALQAIALMKQGSEVTLTAPLALQAAKLSTEHKLPMADSIILATARAYQAIVWTQDVDFAGIESIEYFSKTNLNNRG